jgi:DNA gyrase subunit A
VVTGNGFGKRTPMADYPRKGRPTKGVRTIKVTDRKGELVTARPVREGQELVVISEQGKVIRIAVESMRRTGRSTEGVRLMDLPADDRVSGVASVVEEDAGVDDEAAGAPIPEARPDAALEAELMMEAIEADMDVEPFEPDVDADAGEPEAREPGAGEE